MKKISLLLAYVFIIFSGLMAQNKLYIDFKTGDDDLQKMEFQENPKVTIILNGKPEIVKTSINRGQTWGNNSLRRVTIDLPGDITKEDFKQIKISRTPVYGRQYVWDYLKKDNWTLKGLTVTAVIKKDEKTDRYELLNQNNLGNVFRFIFEGGDNIIEGTVFTADLVPVHTVVNNPPGNENALLTAEFGTGGDNLEGGTSNNINLYIHFKNSTRTLTITNLNHGEKWENNSIHTITNRIIPSSADIDISDIKNVVVSHTGGSGMSADNWNLDKFKLTISKGELSKVLVDTSGVPIHRFTGSARRKQFEVEQ